MHFALEMAGSVQAMELAYRITRRGGTTVSAGLPHPDHRWPLQHVNMVAEERTIKGSYVGSCVASRDIPRYIDLYRRGMLPVNKLMSDHIKLEDINVRLRPPRLRPHRPPDNNDVKPTYPTNYTQHAEAQRTQRTQRKSRRNEKVGIVCIAALNRRCCEDSSLRLKIPTKIFSLPCLFLCVLCVLCASVLGFDLCPKKNTKPKT